MESSYLHTASVPLWTKGLLSSFHPWSTPHWSSSWMPWLPGYLMMIAWNGRTQNLCLWPPYIYLLRTMRSHTLQSDWSARHSPSQWWLWVLDITMYHCAHQHGLVGAEGGHDTTFSPLTLLCALLWRVVIQGHGLSSHYHQTFLQCPLFFDLYVPIQHSCLLHPYEPRPNTFHSKSVCQSRLIILSLNTPLPSGGSWGA